MDNQALKAKHLNALRALGFTGSFRTLRTLERRASWNNTLLCSSPEDGGIDQDEHSARKEAIREQVKRLFGDSLPAGFRIGNDPRGPALRIDPTNDHGEVIHPEWIPAGLSRGWGNEGFLAPESFND